MNRCGHTDGVHRTPRTCAGGQRFDPRHRLVIAVAAWALLSPCVLNAQKSKAPEYDVKATYLYNFARFVEWPEGSPAAKDGSLSICVLGQDPFGAALDTIVSGESIAGKTVVTRRLANARDAVNCHILYISLSEDARLPEILTAIAKSGVLTVSDMPQFSKRGGMIQFVSESNKIRFAVNLASARNSGLTLSSELLKVAVTVITNPGPGD